jgi:hypothetical protein
MPFKAVPVEERFWDKVDKSGDCWLWTAGKYSNGYGMIGVNGKVKVASRVSYELTYGEIPEGMHICHKCDNPSCVRPDHLFVGSRSVNMKDCFTKKRGKIPHSGYGENARNAKLTMEQVREIRRRHIEEKIGAPTLAKMYGVGRSTITRIIKNETYKEGQGDTV